MRLIHTTWSVICKKEVPQCSCHLNLQQGAVRGDAAAGPARQGVAAARPLQQRGRLRPPGVVRHVGAPREGRRVRDAPGRRHRRGVPALR